MARDRKRAKARRRAPGAPSAPPADDAAQATSGAPLEPESRSTVIAPDPVDEASGTAEEAKAASRGIAPVGDLAPSEQPAPDELAGTDGAPTERAPDEEPAPLRARRRGARPAAEGDAEDEKDLAEARRAQAAREREGNRVAMFIRACWDELQRVQWPDRRQVAQATGVVLAFVVIAGGFLGLADAVVSRLVNLIL